MTALSPAKELEQVLDLFEPTTEVDATLESAFYVDRNEDGLKKLTRKLERNKRFHGFLCGHVGSGKSTELRRLTTNEKIKALYLPLFISVQSLQIDNVNLTHDALLLGIGLQLIEHTDKRQLDPKYQEQLNQWGKSLVKTYIKDESIDSQIGAKADAWLVFFKALLKSRTTWKLEEKLNLEPKILDLIMILNNMAQDLFNNTGKRLLVMIDDLEKGDSDAEKQMHHRLFSEYYSVLTQPNFNIIYTLPVYFRGLVNHRIPKESIFSFSAVRIYDLEHKKANTPPLNKELPGYKLIKKFIDQRLDSAADLFEENVLDELILIGGGLFRDTDAVIVDATYYAIDRNADQVSMQDAKKAFDNLKKDYQPFIRGNAIDVLSEVVNSEKGWVENVEPFLQSRAVVEYENGDIWLDVRYVLKSYLTSVLADKKEAPAVITHLS